MNMPRTKLIPNGDNIVHTFTDTEHEHPAAKYELETLEL